MHKRVHMHAHTCFVPGDRQSRSSAHGQNPTALPRGQNTGRERSSVLPDRARGIPPRACDHSIAEHHCTVGAVSPASPVDLFEHIAGAPVTLADLFHPCAHHTHTYAKRAVYNELVPKGNAFHVIMYTLRQTASATHDNMMGSSTESYIHFPSAPPHWRQPLRRRQSDFGTPSDAPTLGNGSPRIVSTFQNASGAPLSRGTRSVLQHVVFGTFAQEHLTHTQIFSAKPGSRLTRPKVDLQVSTTMSPTEKNTESTNAIMSCGPRGHGPITQRLGPAQVLRVIAPVGLPPAIWRA